MSVTSHQCWCFCCIDNTSLSSLSNGLLLVLVLGKLMFLAFFIWCMSSFYWNRTVYIFLILQQKHLLFFSAAFTSLSALKELQYCCRYDAHADKLFIYPFTYSLPYLILQLLLVLLLILRLRVHFFNLYSIIDYFSGLDACKLLTESWCWWYCQTFLD